MTLTVAIGNGSWYPAVSMPANSIVVNNADASTRTNYPLQIGRPFRQGEIPSGQSPVFSDNGTILTTQADVKNRWPDGSVKFAVMSAVIPSLSASTRKTLNIVPGSSPAGSGLTVAQFLSSNPDFDVTLEFSSGATGTVSARAMMVANAVTNWCSGPVMTSWIVADHLGKAFDVGSDASKSIRPMFHIQKWAGQNTYRARIITEISDTTKLQDQTYAVQISSGIASPSVILQTPTFTHFAGSRWSREFWIGTDKPSSVVGVNYNIAYLGSTKAIPNYDPSITLSNVTVTNFLTSWASADKNPFGAGLWQKQMPAAGGTEQIGIFPGWHVWMMYSDNPSFQQAVREQTDLAGAWSMNFRIGSSRTFDSTTGANANGLIPTRDSNPYMFYGDGNAYMRTYFVPPEDAYTFVGTYNVVGWGHDASHQPDPWYPTYLLTGDYWYLSQLQSWGSWGIFQNNAGTALWASGRDPRDTVINDQLRGMAWNLRTRARSAWASLDGTPEKTYLTRATEQALRMFEGSMIGAGGTDPIRAWWATNDPRPVNPLRFFTMGIPIMGEQSGNPNAATGESPWQFSMMYQVLGHVTELGFGSQTLLTWAAQGWITMATTPGVDPRHLADYRVAVIKKTGGFFQTWGDAFDIPGWTSNWERDLNDLTHGYSIFATAAMSFLKNESGGTAAWAWVNTNGYQVINWANNPKMAIIPR